MFWILMIGFHLLMSLTVDYLSRTGVYKASIYKGSKNYIYVDFCICYKNILKLFYTFLTFPKTFYNKLKPKAASCTLKIRKIYTPLYQGTISLDSLFVIIH